MINALIDAGGVIFWLCILGFFSLISFSSAWDRWHWPFVWTIVAAFVLIGFSDITQLSFFNDPATIVIAAIGYVSIGAGWSLFKWWRLVAEIRLHIDEIAKNYDDDGSMRAYGLRDYFEPHDVSPPSAPLTIPPTPREFHTRIKTWIAFWPFSMVSGFFAIVLPWLWENIIISITKGVWRFFGMIANLLSGILTGISSRAFEDYKPDKEQP